MPADDMKRSHFVTCLLGTGAALAIPSICSPQRIYGFAQASSKTEERGWLPGDPKIFGTAHDGAVLTVRFSPDGKHLISSGVDKKAVLWDFDSGKRIRTFPGAEYKFQDAAFSTDGRSVLVPGMGQARLWDLKTGSTIATLEGGQGVLSTVAVSPNGELAAGGGFDSAIYVWNLKSGKKVGELTSAVRSTVTVSFISNDELASADEDGVIRVWSIRRSTPVLELDTRETITSADFATDGIRAITSTDFGLSVWDVKSSSSEKHPRAITLHRFDNIVVMAAGTIGDLVAAGTQDGALVLWNAKTGKILPTARGPWNYITCLAFQPGQRSIALGTDKGQVGVWK